MGVKSFLTACPKPRSFIPSSPTPLLNPARPSPPPTQCSEDNRPCPSGQPALTQTSQLPRERNYLPLFTRKDTRAWSGASHPHPLGPSGEEWGKQRKSLQPSRARLPAPPPLAHARHPQVSPGPHSPIAPLCSRPWSPAQSGPWPQRAGVQPLASQAHTEGGGVR